MEDVGSVVISGKSSEIGKILSVNLKFCSIFKYDSSQLLNNSINKIMPQYLSQYHDNFIKRYMESAKKNILDQDRILFGLKSTGFIRPTLIQVKLIPNLKDNIRFIGLVKKLKKTDNFFFTSDYTNYISTSFILTTEQGNVYGITKNVCENFGIPLNMLLNYKGNSDQTKILNINTIFPQIKFEDEETTKGLDADNGKIIKLDSRSLKSFYEDFKETVMEGKNKTFKFLFKKDESSENIFTEHDILLFMHNISFNDNQVNCKVFKFVKLPSLFRMSPIRCSFLEEKNSFFHNTWVGLEGQLLSPLKKENENYISSNSFNNTNNKIDQDKNNYLENNKYKQNLFTLNSPKQVKIFIMVVVLVIILLITISIIELVLTINNVNTI
jgi:PAS domain S-box-containing protein